MIPDPCCDGELLQESRTPVPSVASVLEELLLLGPVVPMLRFGGGGTSDTRPGAGWFYLLLLSPASNAHSPLLLALCPSLALSRSAAVLCAEATRAVGVSLSQARVPVLTPQHFRTAELSVCRGRLEPCCSGSGSS